MRFSLLLLLCLPFGAPLAWSGISAFLAQRDSDWVFVSGDQSADLNYYGLQIEDRTRSALRVGASAGQFDLRLRQMPALTAGRYSGKFLSFYLRLPQALNDQLKFHSALAFRYFLGERSLQQNEQISWSEVALRLGISLQLGNLSLQPFGFVQSVDGDITSPTQTRLFAHKASSGYGVIVDYYVEPTAYIRFRTSVGAEQGMSLSFVREY